MFSPGDKVDYCGHKGTIEATSVPVKDDGGKLGASVKWDQKDLIPNPMAIPYKDLKFDVLELDNSMDLKIDPSMCVHNYKLHKGFNFDKLICDRCGNKKHYNPMEG